MTKHWSRFDRQERLLRRSRKLLQELVRSYDQQVEDTNPYSDEQMQHARNLVYGIEQELGLGRNGRSVLVVMHGDAKRRLGVRVLSRAGAAARRCMQHT